MRSGWLRGSIYWVLLVWGSVCVSRTIIPDAQEHFLTPSAHRDTHLFGGLEVREDIIAGRLQAADVIVVVQHIFYNYLTDKCL